MSNTKVVDLFKINNFVFKHFFRISYILEGKLDFWFLEKSF